MTYKFFHSVDNPTGLTGSVGGAIDVTNPFSGYLDELFVHVAAPPSGINTGAFQYRQLYVRNDQAKTSTSTRIWLDSVEHSGQIHIGLASGTAQSSASPTGEPAGVPIWYHPIDYSTGLEIGSMATGAASGVWLRQSLSGIVINDPYATFRFHIGGIVE